MENNIIEINKNGKEVLKLINDGSNSISDKLHPNYQYPFKSFLGVINSMENAILFINKPTQYLKYLSSPLNIKILTLAKKAKTINVKNYWKIISLLSMERILSDKDLVDDILNLPIKNIDTFRSVVYRKMKKGVVEILEKDNNITYGKIIKSHIYAIKEGFKIDKTSVKDLAPDEYKEIKNSIKDRLFKRLIEGLPDNELLLSPHSDLPLETLAQEYLR